MRTLMVVLGGVIVVACGDDQRIGEAAPRCGDGVVQAGEGCDLGAANSEAPDAACRIDCQPRRCGDGVVDPAAGEACDGATGDVCGCREGCAFEPTTTVCRASVGACDADDTCDGAGACRGDGKRVGTVCRAAAGACDAPERCSGESDACPADVIAEAGVVCRPSLGACDTADACDGISAACGEDVRADDGTACVEAGCADGCLCDAGRCVAHCGNGTREAALGEVCDDGAANGSFGACRQECDGVCEIVGLHAWEPPPSLGTNEHAVAPDGRRYVVGNVLGFQPPVTIAEHPVVVQGLGDAIVVAIDPDDEVPWIQCFSSDQSSEGVNAVQADADGLTVAGFVGPGARIGCCGDVDRSACPEVVPPGPDHHVFVARLDRDGELVWFASAPTAVSRMRIARAPDGDTVVVAFGYGLFDFGEAAAVVDEFGGAGAVIMRFSPEGVARWVRAASLGIAIEDVAVTPRGTIVLAGPVGAGGTWLGHTFEATPNGAIVSALIEVDAEATRVLGVRSLRGASLEMIEADATGVWGYLMVQTAVELDVGGAEPLAIPGPGAALLHYESLSGSAPPASLALAAAGYWSPQWRSLARAPRTGVLVALPVRAGFELPGVPGVAPPVSGAALVAHVVRGTDGLEARWASVADKPILRPEGLGSDASGRVSLFAVTPDAVRWGDVTLPAGGGIVTLGLPAGCDGCGDGATHGREVCDDGDVSDCTGTCDAACTGPANVCGDGRVACGERFDPGGGPAAPETCGGCGNGVATPGERCDVGELGARDGCTAACDGVCDVVGRWTSVLGAGPTAVSEVGALDGLSDGGVVVGATFRGPLEVPVAGGPVTPVTIDTHGAGDVDTLVYALDGDGDVRWATCFGTPGPETTVGVRADGAGVWVTGQHLSAPADYCCSGIDPAAEPRTCDDDVVFPSVTGGAITGVARYDAAGRFQWARGGTLQGRDARVDAAGDLVVLGVEGSPRPVVWSGRADLPASDDLDVTMLALAPDGALRWFHTYRQVGAQDASALAVATHAVPADAAASWIIGRVASGSFTLAGDTVAATSAPTIYVAAFDAAGDPLWLVAPAALTPAAGSVLSPRVAYGCRAAGDCALFAAVAVSPADSAPYAVLTRLDGAGQVVAETRLTGEPPPTAFYPPVVLNGLSVDRRGRATLVGTFNERLSLGADGGPILVASTATSPTNDTDAFIARATWDLDWLWARRAGTVSGDALGAAAPAGDGGVFLGWLARLADTLTVDDVVAGPTLQRVVVTRLAPREAGCTLCGDDMIGPGEICDDGDDDECAGTCDAQCAGPAGGATCAP